MGEDRRRGGVGPQVGVAAARKLMGELDRRGGRADYLERYVDRSGMRGCDIAVRPNGGKELEIRVRVLLDELFGAKPELFGALVSGFGARVVLQRELRHLLEQGGGHRYGRRRGRAAGRGGTVRRQRLEQATEPVFSPHRARVFAGP